MVGMSNSCLCCGHKRPLPLLERRSSCPSPRTPVSLPLPAKIARSACLPSCSRAAPPSDPHRHECAAAPPPLPHLPSPNPLLLDSVSCPPPSTPAKCPLVPPMQEMKEEGGNKAEAIENGENEEMDEKKAT